MKSMIQKFQELNERDQGESIHGLKFEDHIPNNLCSF